MFFNADDDEQDFLSSSGGSKLASLFGVDKASNQGGNESLKYTAPKQPKKKEAPNQSGGSPAAVTFATAVHAYKYVDGQYASQGKLGAAILGSPASQDYRILLYVSKQQQVTNVRITPAFVFTIQANNYASFYDDARQSWSLMFDSEQNSEKFAKEMGLAKANIAGTSQDSVVTQDLKLGDGGPLETGDLVEVKYTGWLLTNGTFGQEFDSNMKTDKQFKFKIGKGKVIKGWDIGVVGMKKGSKRLLVVPPGLGYGSQGAGNKVPPNSTLIFEVVVVRVKLAKGESPKPSPTPTPEPIPPHNTTPSPSPSDPELDDSTVKGRTRSISEQLAHQGGSKSDKANLISRMAKMGKPMLPLQGAVAAEPDSEEEPVPESPKPVAVTAAPVTVQAPQHAATRPPVVAKPVAQQPMAAQMDYTQTAVPPVTNNPMMHQPAFAPPPGHQMAVYQSPQAYLQQQQATFLQQQQLQQQAAFQPPVSSAFPAGPYPGAPPFPPAAPLGQPDATTPMLLSETRQQNTELRLAVGKMADKVDTVLQKMDHLQTQQSGALTLQSSAPNMEASVLMHNVQRIVQENDRLRKEGYERNSRIEAQNDKISDLLQSNQMFVEKSQTLLEQRNEGFKVTATTSQAKVLLLEQEKVHLATELSTATSQLGTLQLEIAGMRKREMELQQKLGSSSNDYQKNTEELENLQSQHTEDEERIKNLTSGLREEKQRRKDGDNKLSQLTEELADLRVTAESLQKNLGERKKKAAEERRKMEEDMEDNKLQLEQEIQSLREKLRRQKTSTDVAKAEQVSKLEEEIVEEWKAKTDKQLAAAQDRHARTLQGVKEEKEELEQKVTELESKIQSLRRSSGGSEEHIRTLQDQLDDLAGWKDKYDSLRGQASAMKDKYEARISEVEEDRDGLASERDQLSEHVDTLQKHGASPAPSGGSGGGSVITEVKKIMNSVYQQLRAQFTAEENYSGADVLAAILGAIKTTTLKLVQQPSQGPSAEEEEEEEEEEDEEEEEEEDEEELEDSEDDDDKESPHPITETAEPPAEKETAAQSTEKQDPPEESEESDDFDEEEEEKLPHSPDVPKVTENGLPTEDPVVEPQPQQTDEISQSVDNSGLETMENKQGVDNSGLETTENKQGVDNSNEQQDNEPVIEQSVTENTPETNHIAPEIPKSEPVKRESESSEIIPATSRTPPPLLDDDDEEEEEEEDTGDKPLFGEDDTVEDTLGISFKPKTDKDIKKDKKLPTKTDFENDEDLRPQPPPPLFGDDSDDNDLDWLS